ncbi:MAG: MFS transporter [Firmicutes bacterium]|nr:MFS transporter [Bacillota bacterium]
MLGLASFALIESRQAEPLLRLALFQIRVISFSLLAAFFQGLGGFAVLFLIMMYLQGVRGLTPLDASLLLVPGYLVGGIAGPFGGRLADRFGSVLPATIGLGIQAVAILVYAQVGIATPLYVIIIASILNGIGSGGFFPANNSAVMKGAPPGEYGIASGMLRTFANVGMVMSFAVALVMASTRIPRGLAFAIFVGSTHLHAAQLNAFVSGLHVALYICIGSLLLAGIGSSVRGSTTPTALPNQRSLSTEP